MRSVYIITKPLQYINATNIPDNCIQKDCYIMNSFYKAEEFVIYIKKNVNRWNRIEFIKNGRYIMRYYIFLKIIFNRSKYTHLYTDFDYGSIHTILFFFLRKLCIYTYEEGFGSYRQYVDKGSFFSSISTYLKKKFRSKNWIGGNRFSKGGYFYYPSVMKLLNPESTSKNILSFRNSYLNHINTLPEIDYFINGIDFNKYLNKKICIYLSSWVINPEYEFVMKNYENHYKILKLHPHITNIEKFPNFDEIIRIIPAEIFLIKLIPIAAEVIVIHENSTSLIYLLSEEIKSKITEINLAFSENSEYNTIRKEILFSKKK